MSKILCERLKQERKKANLTQNEVAQILKISQSTYAGYETGKSEPNIEIITKIADVFKTSIDYLTGRYK